MSNAANSFKINVSTLLNRAGWSQSELARRMKMAQSAVNRYLRGENIPGIDVVERFAEVFGVTVSELLSSSAIPSPRIERTDVPAEIQKAIEEGIKRGLEQANRTSPSLPPEIEAIAQRAIRKHQEQPSEMSQVTQGKGLQDVSAEPLVERVQAKVAQLERIRLENLEMLIDKQLERQRAKKSSASEDEAG